MRKKSLRIFLVLALFLSVLLVASCGAQESDTQTDIPGNNPQQDGGHVHSFDEWVKNESTHQKACSCGALDEEKEHNDENGDALCDECGYSVEKKTETVSLDGKKVIFIGDSFIYYGQTVLYKGTNKLTQSSRVNDEGFFYQLCLANGENVSVTNFTFGGHGLSSFTSRCCNAGKSCEGEDHFAYLHDLNYDYVVLSGGRGSSIKAEDFLYDVEYIMAMFRAVNPDVQFVYLVSQGAHNVSVNPTFPTNVLNNLKTIEKWGVTIVDWGKLVADVIRGNVSVEGSEIEYNKNSFAVCQSKNDGYHPSQLAGYITTVMTYCAITGKSAVNMPYYFVGDDSFSKNSEYRTFEEFVKKYYTYNGATTNYPEVFASGDEVLALQKLMDVYLEEKAYRNYNFEEGFVPENP